MEKKAKGKEERNGRKSSEKTGLKKGNFDRLSEKENIVKGKRK